MSSGHVAASRSGPPKAGTALRPEWAGEGDREARPTFAVLACVLALTLACTSAATRNRDNLQRLSLDMSKAEVLGVMGPPDSNEAFLTTDGGRLEVLYFVAENYASRVLRNQRGDSDNPAMTPIVLLNDRLIGWGTTFWEKEKPLRVDVHVH